MQAFFEKMSPKAPFIGTFNILYMIFAYFFDLFFGIFQYDKAVKSSKYSKKQCPQPTPLQHSDLHQPLRQLTVTECVRSFHQKNT